MGLAIQGLTHESNFRKAPLNRMIRAAASRSTAEATMPTLKILRNALLSGLASDQLEVATGPNHGFRGLIERAAQRIV